MLWNHVRANGTDKNQILPIGHWVNLRKEGGKLMADPEFDMEDSFAAEIARKVEAGHIFEASAGLKPRKWDAASMVSGQTLPTLAASKIREASICDVASNDNALALYDEQDRLVDLNDKTALVSLTAGDTSTSPTIHNMEELKIIGGQLGLTGNITLTDVQSKINALIALNAENADLKAKLKKIEDDQKAAQAEQIKTLVDAAVNDNRITQASRPVYIKLFEADFESTKAVLEALPKTVKLSEYAGGSKQGQNDFTWNGKTFSQLRKENPAALQNLKDNDFATFNLLYKAEYSKDYKTESRD